MNPLTLIPRKTVYRFSVYLRSLQRLHANGLETVSSDVLARLTSVKAAQLRKDLAYLGHSGTRGIGYSTMELIRKLTEALGTNRLLPVILVGVGNLGSALLGYSGFAKEGFEIVAGFDVEPRDRQQIPIFAMHEVPSYVRDHGIKMAVITVPGRVAQEVTNTLCEAGIQALLNFAPIVLQVPPEITVNNVNLAVELENLAYSIRPNLS
ncbi:MAG: redox-sensing transcriptional repressor Rex [Verrucomicrobiales bacterium]